MTTPAPNRREVIRRLQSADYLLTSSQNLSREGFLADEAFRVVFTLYR